MFCYTSFILVSLIASVVALPMENQWHTGMNQGGEFYSHFPPSNYGWTPFYTLSGGQQEAITYQQPHETNRGFAAPVESNNSQFSYFLHEPQLSHDGTHLTHSRSVSGAEHPSLYQQGQFLSPAEMYEGSQIQAPADFHEGYLPAANDMHGVYPVAHAHGGYGTGFFTPSHQANPVQHQPQQQNTAEAIMEGQSSRPPYQRQRSVRDRITYVDSADQLPMSLNNPRSKDLLAIGSFHNFLATKGKDLIKVESDKKTFISEAGDWVQKCEVPEGFKGRGELLRSLLEHIGIYKSHLQEKVDKKLRKFSYSDKLAAIPVSDGEKRRNTAND